MSINWVMLAQRPPGFVSLPGENLLFTSPPRTSLHLTLTTTGSATTNTAGPYELKSDSGLTFITNQRIIYLLRPQPSSSDSTALASFSAPIHHVTDSRVRAPFFGANYWQALVRPVVGGGLPAEHAVFELRITFREGGAFDFHTRWEEVRERLLVAHESGGPAHLEQLPVYEATATNTLGGNAVMPSIGASTTYRASNTLQSQRVGVEPDEPPPGYEEAQLPALGVAASGQSRTDADDAR